MTRDSTLRSNQWRRQSHDGAKASQRVRKRGVNDEPVTQRIEASNHVESILAKTRRPLAKDRCVNCNHVGRVSSVRPALSRPPDQRRRLQSSRVSVRFGL